MTEIHSHDTAFFGSTDKDARFFLDAMSARFGRILASSGAAVRVQSQPSTYVVPGSDILVIADAITVPVWVGVNCGRIIFILRMAETVERCRKAFEFAFGGAARVGWNFHYEPIGEAETSVWGTLEQNDVFVAGAHNTIPGPELTRAGAFWANDTAMMMQSAVRTIERQGLAVASRRPEPL